MHGLRRGVERLAIAVADIAVQQEPMALKQTPIVRAPLELLQRPSMLNA
jgi:hypothetical protein